MSEQPIDTDYLLDCEKRLEEANQRITELEQLNKQLPEFWGTMVRGRDERIAQLENFVRWVHDEGSDYWRTEAEALLE